MKWLLMAFCALALTPYGVHAQQAAPSFDVKAYCHNIGEVSGGSAELELSCRHHESDAAMWIRLHPTSTNTYLYCKNIGQTAGGSFELMQSCIQHEEQAQQQLDQMH
jgi:hypothetical protein